MGKVLFECAQPMGSMKLEDAGYGLLLVVEAGDGKAPSTLRIPSEHVEAFADAVRGGLTTAQAPTRETCPAPCVNGEEMERIGEGWRGSGVVVGPEFMGPSYGLRARFEDSDLDEYGLLGESVNSPQNAVDELLHNFTCYLRTVDGVAASLGIRHDPSITPTCTPAPAPASTQSDGEVSAIQDPQMPAGETRFSKSAEVQCRQCDRMVELDVRAEVCSFAESMERKLIANDHKAHWLRSGDVPFFLKRLWGELEELEDAILGGMNPDMVEAEAADVACFAMFVAQRTRQDFEVGGK